MPLSFDPRAFHKHTHSPFSPKIKILTPAKSQCLKATQAHTRTMSCGVRNAEGNTENGRVKKKLIKSTHTGATTS